MGLVASVVNVHRDTLDNVAKIKIHVPVILVATVQLVSVQVQAVTHANV